MTIETNPFSFCKKSSQELSKYDPPYCQSTKPCCFLPQAVMEHKEEIYSILSVFSNLSNFMTLFQLLQDTVSDTFSLLIWVQLLKFITFGCLLYIIYRKCSILLNYKHDLVNSGLHFFLARFGSFGNTTSYVNYTVSLLLKCS